MAAAAAAAVGGGAAQLSAFHKANSTTTNSNSSNYSAASSATAAGGSTQGEGETWANVVARRNSKSRRSFTTTSDAPPVSSASAPLAMPVPVALPGVEDRGVSAVVPVSSSSACGRKDCPCCASHAAAAAGAGGPGPATPGGTSGKQAHHATVHGIGLRERKPWVSRGSSTQVFSWRAAPLSRSRPLGVRLVSRRHELN